MDRSHRWISAIGKYLVALVSILVATLVRMLVDPIVGEMHPFVTYIFAILFCAWYCGLGPAIVTLVLGFMAAAYFFASPRGSIAIYGADVQVGLVLYIILSISSIIFSEQMHSANRRAEATSQQLRKKHSDLEHEIQRRKDAEMEKIALLRKVVSLQEDERLRISRELHDQCGQDLVALQLGIQFAINKSKSGSPDGSTSALIEANAILGKLSKELHTLAFELRPPSLDEMGLQTAVESLLEDWSHRSKVAVDFECRNWNKGRISSEASLVLYRVLQESLNNVAKHSGATQISVILEMQKDQIIEIIEDHGCGIDSKSDDRSIPIHSGLGIQGMTERLASVGGSLEIESDPAHGTTVFARIPLKGNSLS